MGVSTKPKNRRRRSMRGNRRHLRGQQRSVTPRQWRGMPRLLQGRGATSTATTITAAASCLLGALANRPAESAALVIIMCGQERASPLVAVTDCKLLDHVVLGLRGGLFPHVTPSS